MVRRVIVMLLALLALAGASLAIAGPTHEAVLQPARFLIAAEDSARFGGRADDLTRALDPVAQNSRTAAAMSTREGVDVLAGGGRDLSPAQRALASSNDVLGRMTGAHAEVTAMDAAAKEGLTPWQMAVSRPICSECQAAIEGSGGTVAPDGLSAWWPW